MARSPVRWSCAAVTIAAAVGAAVAFPAVARAGPATSPSAADQQAVVETLDDAAPRVPDAVGAWYVDPATGSVVVETTDVRSAASFVAAAGADAGAVEVRRVAETPRRYLGGGDAILDGAGRCSAGFTATDGTTGFVVTAGHCTAAGSSWTTGSGEAIGPSVDSSFPVDDYGLIEVTNPALPLTGEVTGIGPVSGAAEASVGDEVCRSGATTGVDCGTIQAFGATVNYGGGDVVSGLVQTDACAEPGDSGGPWVADGQAQGLTSGGSGDCTSGGTTFYQPIAEALDDYGLTLITG